MLLGIGDFVLIGIFGATCVFFYKRGYQHGIRYGLDEILEEMED